MAKEKAVNYTAEQVEVLKSSYTGADNSGEVKALAEKLGKTPASVRAKLANLGLYKSEEKAEEKSDRVTKLVIAEAIGEKIALLEHEVEGLAKAPKAALDKVLKALS